MRCHSFSLYIIPLTHILEILVNNGVYALTKGKYYLKLLTFFPATSSSSPTSSSSELLTADGSLNAVLDSPKVEGYRRRPRWWWSPVATQILSEAFKKVRSSAL